jgi:hypothetical protein
MAGEGPIGDASLRRVAAVAIGCSVAILIQLLTMPLIRRTKILDAPNPNSPAAAPITE